MPDPQNATARLQNYPVTFFTVAMGLLGLTLAARVAEQVYDWGHRASTVALVVSVVALVLISLGYLAKIARYPGAVAAEWRHQVRIAFFPTISISGLLLATALLEIAPASAHLLWGIFVAEQGVLALGVIAAWISHRPFHPGGMTPAWFIPAVGNVIVPLAGVPLGHPQISWLFFSGGVIFWLVLLTQVFNRLMFHDPLPGKLVPTLMILVAPPAVAFSAWLRLTGEVGPVGEMLIGAAYVFALIVATQIGKLRNVPFALSWWALSFPLAALSIASFRYGQAMASDVHVRIGAALLVLLVVVIILLVTRTLNAMRLGEICQPE